MGYCQMVSLGSCQVCSPQMGLQPTESEPPFTAHRTRHKRKAAVWSLASWNVRSLVDVEGPVQTARQRKEVTNAEERRIDQVVSELYRYKIDVAALQETKWVGDAAYRVGDSMVLTAGRKTLDSDETRVRGEGVALVLSSKAKFAWKEGGSKWKACSSVTMQLIPCCCATPNRSCTSYIIMYLSCTCRL